MKYVIERCCLDDVLTKYGKTRSDIEQITGINRRQISRYAKGRSTMQFETAVTIAAAIDPECDPRELYVWMTVPLSKG
ncbi:helix-turn-helix domain-containing protein [Paenibacillus naphthalenovorans]|uniref:helix-turn-helix domain-containing protein n=1 Tax=Paenibacillus naphthalenovorans TaxID=162209 RepID=UPI003D2C014F